MTLELSPYSLAFYCMLLLYYYTILSLFLGDICCARAINYVCEGDGIAVVEFEYKSLAPGDGINIDLGKLFAQLI